MKQQDNTVEFRDNACETRESPSFGGIPVVGWGWPDEDRLAAFAEQTDWAEHDDQAKRVDQTLDNDPEYATLYFVS